MGIFTGFIEEGFTNTMTVHCFCQGIPCAKIFPHPAKAHDFNIGFLLDYGIIKADFGQGFIFVKQILIILKLNEFMSALQYIS